MLKDTVDPKVLFQHFAQKHLVHDAEEDGFSWAAKFIKFGHMLPSGTRAVPGPGSQGLHVIRRVGKSTVPAKTGTDSTSGRAPCHGSTAADEVTNRFASAHYIAVDHNGELELAKVETWLSLHHSHQAQCVPRYFVSGGSTRD
ncbi:hypothetical protein MMC29_000306 [Sticta canariensis]|nr:hypothetical protein [Sticta canariensis]